MATVPRAPERAHGQLPGSLGVIIVAAGESRRMAGVDKIFAPLLGVPLIAHTVEALEACPNVRDMVLVLSPDRMEEGKELSRQRGWLKATPERVCRGGPRRQDSVRLGLEHLSPCPWMVVHDGARPCLEPELLERGLRASQETGASVAAVPAKDTIKVVANSGLIEATPPRDSLWLVQTPQVFKHELLSKAHESCNDTVTDDASMVERLGYRVKVFMGSYSNLKVTTPDDVILAESILRARLSPHGARTMQQDA